MRPLLCAPGVVLCALLLALAGCGEDALQTTATDVALPDVHADVAPDVPAAADTPAADQTQPLTDTLVGDAADAVVDALPDSEDLVVADVQDGSVPDVAIDVAETAANQAPTIQITAPKTGDVLTKGITAHFEAKVADPDDAPETLVVVWTTNLATAPLAFAKANAQGISAFDTGALPAGVQTLTAQVSDPSGAKAKDQLMMLVNSAPGAPVIAITPPNPIATDALVAQIAVPATDADRAPGELTYSYQWLKAGVATPFQAATLPAGTTKKGEAWKVQVTAKDPYAAGPAGFAEVVIGDAAPTAPAVELTPTAVDQLTTVTCAVTTQAQDADGDVITYKFSWLVGGVVVTQGQDASLVVGSLGTNGKIIKQGDQIQCRATPNDGTLDGASGTSAPASVGATDVCGSDANPCSPNATCTNTLTSQPICTCKPGFEGDGKTCAQVTCSDGKKNGDETGPDCGGSKCGGCASGFGCASGADCLSTHCDASFKCVACLAATDCPGSENGCQKRTCNAGACGLDLTPAATVLATQIVGDCKTAQCDGAGNIQQVPLDTDIPNDGLYCTVDTCSGGVAANTPMAVGTACAENGGIQCNAAGACAQTCTVASQCPGADSECETIICSDNLCGVTFAAAGKVVSQQTTGDCKQNRCNGVGGVIAVPANGDFPVDNNSCTIDACQAGVPSNPPEMAGTPCSQNGGNVCDGKGACIGCLVATDCPGSDTECKLRACSAGQCTATLVAAGKVTATQKSGDCKQNQCDGLGGINAVASGSDLPVDGNPCTYDVCSAGKASNPPALAGTTCSVNGGFLCDGKGSCVQCLTGSDCPTPANACQQAICTAGVCDQAYTAAGTPMATQVIGDCKKQLCDGSGGVATVIDNGDLPVDGKQCTSDLCKMGVPSNPLLTFGTACTQDGGVMCDGAGACVQCTKASDCPGTDTLCQARTCKSNLCGIEVQAAGTPVGSQMPGDCKSNQCDGFGSAIWGNDPTDVPVDGNPCTDDLCNAGVASNPPSAAGTACSTSGGHICDGKGSCIGCSKGADCPGDDTECHTRTCTDGLCGLSVAAAGTVLAKQIAGDCATAQCDGAGATVAVANASDLPVDGKICTLDVCTGTTPSNPPVPAGAACNQDNGAVCSGSGACVQCNTASDCPGLDNECQTRVCTAGKCSFTFVAAGTLLAVQTSGDCRQASCSGTGGIASTILDTDLPVDGNPCTLDVCLFGNPMNPPVAAGIACSGGICNGGGTCVQCTSPTDCPGTDNECGSRTCNSGKCGMNYVPAGQATYSQIDGDCKQNQCNGTGVVVSVALDTDIGYDTNQCTLDICTSGVLSHPFSPASSVCSQNGGYACDGAGQCVQCAVAADCGTGDTDCQKHTCTAHKCGLLNVAAGTVTTNQIAGDCRQYQCDGNGAIVSVVVNTDVPNDQNTCTLDTCKAGIPTFSGVAAGTACSQNGGKVCDGNGSCVECVSASACPGTDTECQSRMCSGGACAINKIALGTPTATQTPNDCKKNVCDGKGAVTSINDDLDFIVDGNDCTSDLCTNGTPSNPPLASHTACLQNGGKYCDGKGACLVCLAAADCPGTSTSCQPINCTANACVTTTAAIGAPCTENGGKLCDDKAHCAQCLTAADCGADTECAKRTCLPAAGVNVCGLSYTAFGTELVAQKSGDCADLQCDGGGGVQAMPLGTDLPLDGNDCTQDLCTLAVASNPAYPSGTPCKTNGGKVCDGAGKCVLCMLDTDCSTGTCVNNACTGTSCSDGVKNGTETGVDCGGDCGLCATVLLLANSNTKLMAGYMSAAATTWTTQEITGGSTAPPALAAHAADQAVGLIQLASTNALQSVSWANSTWSTLADVATGVKAGDGPSLASSAANLLACWRVPTTNTFQFGAYGSSWAPTSEAIGTVTSSVSGDIVAVGLDATFVYNDAGTIRAMDRIGGLWSAPVAIATTAATTSAPRIIHLSGGAATDVMVVYADAGTGNPAWFVTRSAGTWAAKKVLDATATLVDRPALMAGAGGMAMLAFRKSDNKVYVSFYGVGVWSAPVAVAGVTNVTAPPSIALGVGAAAAELAYVSGGKAYHARYISAAWSTPAVVGTTTGLLNVTLARTL